MSQLPVFLDIYDVEGSEVERITDYEVLTKKLVSIAASQRTNRAGWAVKAVDVPGRMKKMPRYLGIDVFPQTGDRDTPSRCSGGDTNG